MLDGFLLLLVTDLEFDRILACINTVDHVPCLFDLHWHLLGCDDHLIIARLVLSVRLVFWLYFQRAFINVFDI